jgi:hypothetical protein
MSRVRALGRRASLRVATVVVAHTLLSTTGGIA